MARVVVIDQDEHTQSSIQATLQTDGMDVVTAGDGERGKKITQSKDHDLVILDPHLPDEDGYEVLSTLLQNRIEVPVLLVSSQNEVSEKVKGFELGAVDYLVKPVNPKEFSARVRSILRFKAGYDRLRNQLHTATALSVVDELTGIYNRRHMDKIIREKIALSRRHGHTFTCVMFDVDQFKRTNDTHGHIFGDFVLKEVVARTIKVVRKEDVVTRYGGDEFVVLLAHANRAGAEIFADRLKGKIREQPFDDGEHRADITINIGVATYLEEEGVTSPEELLRFADEELYKAKGSARERVPMD